MKDRPPKTSSQGGGLTGVVAVSLLVIGLVGWMAWHDGTAAAGEPELRALGDPVSLPWAELPAEELKAGLLWTTDLPALSALPIPGVDTEDSDTPRPKLVVAPFTREAPQELLAVSIPNRLGLQRVTWKIRALSSLSHDGSNYLTTFTSSGDSYPGHKLLFAPQFDSQSRVLQLRIGYEFPDGKAYASRLDFVLGRQGFELVTW
jgi:hypothetical protein